MQKMIFLFLVSITTIFTILQALGNVTSSVISTSPEGMTSLQKASKEQIGKIRIPNTEINDIIVQTIDNEFYLNHNAMNQWDKNGAIFLDYRNEQNDKKLLIYGHNSKEKTAPFKELEKYLDKNFFTENPYIELTFQDQSYIYQIFSIMIVKEDEYRHTKLSFQKNEYEEHLSWLKENSIYNTNINLTKKDRILILQTCYYEPENSYLLVNAKGV